jgi:hypothetical protein
VHVPAACRPAPKQRRPSGAGSWSSPRSPAPSRSARAGAMAPAQSRAGPAGLPAMRPSPHARRSTGGRCGGRAQSCARGFGSGGRRRRGRGSEGLGSTLGERFVFGCRRESRGRTKWSASFLESLLCAARRGGTADLGRSADRSRANDSAKADAAAGRPGRGAPEAAAMRDRSTPSYI